MPDKAELSALVDSIVSDVRRATLELTNDTNPDKYSYHKAISVNDNDIFDLVLQGLMIQAGEFVRTVPASGDKQYSEDWTATSNPNIYISTKWTTSSDNRAIDASGKNTKRDIVVAGYDWLKAQGLK